MSSMLHKASTTFLPSSLTTRNQLPISTTNGDHYSSRTTNTSTTASQADAGSSNDELPKGGIRRRLSSLSLNKLQDSISSSIPGACSFNNMRSKSSKGLENAGSSIRKWWELGWSWIISRKPAFAQDLEMNDEETSFLGSHNKGSWLHLFYKLRPEFDKLLFHRSSSNLTLPQTFKYDHKKPSSLTSISFPSGGAR